MFYYFHYFHCECNQASRNFPASAIERPRLATLGPSNGNLHRIPSLQQASRNTVEFGWEEARARWREVEGGMEERQAREFEV